MVLWLLSEMNIDMEYYVCSSILYFVVQVLSLEMCCACPKHLVAILIILTFMILPKLFVFLATNVFNVWSPHLILCC